MPLLSLNNTYPADKELQAQMEKVAAPASPQALCADFGIAAPIGNARGNP
jgi:hypothetical protein